MLSLKTKEGLRKEPYWRNHWRIVLERITIIPMCILMIFSIMHVNWIIITDRESISIENIFSKLDYLALVLGAFFLIGVFYYCKRRSFFRRWKNILTILDNETDNLDTIQTIVIKNLEIRNIVSEIQILKFLDRFFFVQYNYNNILNTLLSNLIKYLTDLRSDLATRLTEQQQILEWAKSEIEHNITGTPELIVVSELQKARLDRQIEQFEELQRVLVRI